jgi:hypothetical protein
MCIRDSIRALDAGTITLEQLGRFADGADLTAIEKAWTTTLAKVQKANRDGE